MLPPPPQTPGFVLLYEIFDAPLNSGSTEKEKIFNKHCRNVYATKRTQLRKNLF